MKCKRVGRTGSLFAHEHEGIAPDIITLAKAMGNGFPMGAFLSTDEIASSFAPGSHASTFGGNPLAMAAALATLDSMMNYGIIENRRKVGLYFLDKLKELKQKHNIVRDVTGRGLMIGMELSMEGGCVVKKCMDKGALINCTNRNVLRFVPPLIVEKTNVDELVNILDEVLTAL